MSGSTISGVVGRTVYLGSGSYSSPLTVTSTGSIVPVAVGNTDYDGVSVAGAGEALVNEGLIEGAYFSLSISSRAFVASGVFSSQDGFRLTNIGTILGGGSDLAPYGGGSGVALGANSTLDNMGFIMGGYGPPGGTGVALGAGDLLDNEGTISGGGGSPIVGFFNNGGIGVSIAAGATLVNMGLVLGGTGTVGGAGVEVGVGGLLVNDGTIGGGARTTGSVASDAVVFDGQGIVIDEANGVFEGPVVGATTKSQFGQIEYLDIFEVAGTSSVALTGFGSQFLNFGTIDFAPGAERTIAGSIGAFTTLQIDGFAAGDEIILDGFTTTGFLGKLNNLGLTSSYQRRSYDLSIYTPVPLSVRNVGGNTVLTLESGAQVSMLGTISGNLSYSVITGTSNYPSPLTITSTGDVAPTTNTYDFGVGFSNATLINYGTVSGPNGDGDGGGAGTGVSAYAQGAVVRNSGKIFGGANPHSPGSARTGSSGVTLYGGSSLFNTGYIKGGDIGGVGVSVSRGGTLTNAGTISGGAVGTLYPGGPVMIVTTLVAVDFNHFSTNVGAGLLVVDPGAVFDGLVEGDASTTDVLEFAGSFANAVAGLGTEFLDFSGLSFAAGAALEVGGDEAAFSTVQVDGFSALDTLDVTDLAFVQEAVVSLGAGGVLDVVQGGNSLNVTFGGATGSAFSIVGDGAGGTAIEEVACYARGTRILTVDGERAVETLQAGDLLPTLHGGVEAIRWIGRRRYGAPFCNHEKVLPVRIAAGALGVGAPRRPLVVSPGHAMCVGGALVHASRLVNGRTIVQAERVEEIEYFHVELATHEMIFAEGAPAESFMGEYFRGQFENAGGYVGAGAPEVGCLPRLEDGARLAAARGEKSGADGELAGFVDAADGGRVCGWAQGLGAPVWLDVLAGGRRVARVVANRYRADVRAAGMGDGYCGFEAALPDWVVGGVEVRRARDGVGLGWAEVGNAA